MTFLLALAGLNALLTGISFAVGARGLAILPGLTAVFCVMGATL